MCEKSNTIVLKLEKYHIFLTLVNENSHRKEVNKLKLKEILRDANISHQQIGENLGIKSLGTVSLKVNGKADWSTTEAMKLKNMINEKTGKNYTFEDLFN